MSQTKTMWWIGFKLHWITATIIKTKQIPTKKKSKDLMRVFGDTIATGVHLAHKDLHGAITSLSLLERVLEPPLHTVRYHQSQWQPILLSLRALHYLLPLRVDSDSPGFRCFRGRDSDSRYGFRASRPWELIWSDNFGELLELGGWRNWFSHKKQTEKRVREYIKILREYVWELRSVLF